MKIAIGATVLVGSVATALWNVDGRYAKADDVKSAIATAQAMNRDQQQRLKEEVQGLRNDLRRIYMRTERRTLEGQKAALQREQFDLVSIQQRRRLTELELKRLQTVTEEIGTITEQIKGLIEKEKQLEGDSERK